MKVINYIDKSKWNLRTSIVWLSFIDSQFLDNNVINFSQLMILKNENNLRTFALN